MDLYQFQIVWIGIIRYFLNFAGIRVLDKHDVFPGIVQPTDEDQFIERRCPHRGNGRGHQRERISLPDSLIAIRFETRRNGVISAWQRETPIPDSNVRINDEYRPRRHLRIRSIPAGNLQFEQDSRRLVCAFQRKTGNSLE